MKFKLNDEVESTVNLGKIDLPKGTKGKIVEVHPDHHLFPYTVDFDHPNGNTWPVKKTEIQKVEK